MYIDIDEAVKPCKQANFVISEWSSGEEKTHTKQVYILRCISHLTLHAAGAPGEQFGLGDRQLEPGPTLFANLRRIR